jgi:autotransporter-associated beta strand protein
MPAQIRQIPLGMLLAAGLFSQPLSAADIIKANNTDALNLATSWSTATAPGTGDVAVWDSTVAAANATNLGTDLSWQGIRIANPGGAVTINNTANVLTLGSAGIDMSAATANLTINTSIVAGADQTWALNGGRTLNLWTVNTSRGLSGSGSITLTRTSTGTGTVIMLPGNNGSTGFNDPNSNSLFSGSWNIGSGVVVQNIRNGATAWGTGTINLSGGQIAQIQGNWTWTNAITLVAATSSSIANSSTGTSRTLKLQGVLSGSGNLTFDDTTGGMTGADNGFILTGTNTLSGQVTIPSSRLVRVGGVPGNDTTTVAGSGGTLGTATVVLNGTLTLSRSNTWTFANDITSGTGVLRIGLGTGSATHIVTVTGNNQHTGGTTLQSAVTLNIGSANALGSGPFTINGNGIFDNTTGSALSLANAFNLSGGSPVFTGTNDVTFNGAVTLAGGNRTITVTNAAATLTLSNAVSGAFNLTKQGAGTLVFGGANTYSGTTTVSAGTLRVNGSTAAASAVSVSGGTSVLAGTGTINGTLNVASTATVSPGPAANPAGTLTVNGATTLAGNYTWELATAGTSSASPGGSTATATQDRLVIANTLIATGAVVNIASLPGSTFDNSLPYSWTIAESTALTGTPTLGTIGGTDFSTLNGGTFSITSDTTRVYLNFTPVPEPVAIFALASLAVICGRRSRRIRR